LTPTEKPLTPTDKRSALRALLASGPAIVAPGVYDCLSSRVVERAGFPVAMASGAGIAASILGVPDIGLMTMTEVLGQTKNMAAAIDIPLVADCDTGFGNLLNVRRTVSEFEAAGVAALFIEDQVTPKRCGHFAGKQVLSAGDMVQKIKAAVDARVDGELLLIARTDARATAGLQEAIRRCELFAEAGAEMLYVEAPESSEELRCIGRRLSGLGRPLMVNLVEGGRTPLLPVAELAEMGFRFITFSGSLQKTSLKAMQGLLQSLHSHGHVGEYYPSAMLSLAERSELLSLDRFMELESRYAAGEATASTGRPRTSG